MGALMDELTDDDRAALTAIGTAPDDRTRVGLLRDYWRDRDRSERAPRWLAYLHLGLLTGMCERLLEQQRDPNAVGWSDKREKAH
jgi:hypothetical protein